MNWRVERTVGKSGWWRTIYSGPDEQKAAWVYNHCPLPAGQFIRLINPGGQIVEVCEQFKRNRG